MAERATIFQTVNIFAESSATPGTSGAATRRLGAMSIEPGIQTTIDTFRPMGSKYMTVAAQGKEWTQASLSGKPTYNEMLYPLSSVITRPTFSSSTAFASVNVATFSPVSTGSDNPATYSVEFGSTERAAGFTHGMVSDFNLSFNRDTADIGGTLFGRAITDGITLTGSTMIDPLQPILPKQISVYHTSGSTNLTGTTGTSTGLNRLVRVLGGEIRIQRRFDPLWTVDASQASFVTWVEVEPTVEVALLQEADSSGMDPLTLLRAGTRDFLRIEAEGSTISGSTMPHLFRFDLAGKVTGVSEFRDEAGVYAVEWTYTADGGSTWGKAFQVLVHSSSTAL